MSQIIIEWEAAGKGFVKVDVEELGMTLDEFIALDEEDREVLLQEIVDEDISALAPGFVVDYKITR